MFSHVNQGNLQTVNVNISRFLITFQYSQTSGAVRLCVFGNTFCTVFINFLYCGLLCPVARMRSGEVMAILLLSPNAIDSTMSLISWDSRMSD